MGLGQYLVSNSFSNTPSAIQYNTKREGESRRNAVPNHVRYLYALHNTGATLCPKTSHPVYAPKCNARDAQSESHPCDGVAPVGVPLMPLYPGEADDANGLRSMPGQSGKSS